MSITLQTHKETQSYFHREVEKDELELMIRRTENVVVPNGWELTDEIFNKLDGEHVESGDDFIEPSCWDDEDTDGYMFGELDDYLEDILDLVGFRKRKVDNPKHDPKKGTDNFFNPKKIEEWYLPKT